LEQFFGGEGFVGLEHCFEDEVKRRRIGLDIELVHLSDEVEEVGGGGPEHEVGAEVVVEEVDVGMVRLAGLVEGGDPGLEVVFDFCPLVRGHVIAEEVE